MRAGRRACAAHDLQRFNSTPGDSAVGLEEIFYGVFLSLDKRVGDKALAHHVALDAAAGYELQSRITLRNRHTPAGD